MPFYLDKKRRAYVAWGQVCPHTVLETQMQVCGDLAAWWALSFWHRTHGDHPGWFFSWSALKLFFVEINLYDTRHEDLILAQQ